MRAKIMAGKKKQKSEKGKKKRGRPTLYRGTYPEITLNYLSTHGGGIKEVAALLRVHRDTVYEWMDLYPDFSDAVNKGRETWDNVQVKNALLQSALGGRYRTIKLKPTKKSRKTLGYIKESECEVEYIVITEVPPNPGACMNWLTNRDPENFKNRRDLSGSVELPNLRDLKTMMEEIAQEDNGAATLVTSGLSFTQETKLVN